MLLMPYGKSVNNIAEDHRNLIINTKKSKKCKGESRGLGRVTRELFEIFGFFSENVEKMWKGPKLSKKFKIYVKKYNLLNFYY